MATDVTLEEKNWAQYFWHFYSNQITCYSNKDGGNDNTDEKPILLKIWVKYIGGNGAIVIVALETGFNFQKRSEESDSLVSMAIESRDMIA